MKKKEEKQKYFIGYRFENDCILYGRNSTRGPRNKWVLPMTLDRAEQKRKEMSSENVVIFEVKEIK